MSARTVLLVEDSPAVRGALAQVLESQALRVAAVGTAPEAERAMLEGPFDVVVVDLDLGDPERDGVDVLVWAHRLRPAAVRVLISGSPSTRIQAALAAGIADRFVRKPFGAEAVTRLVQPRAGATPKVGA